MAFLKKAQDDYLPFNTNRKYIIADKNNKHYGEIIELFNDEQNALYYDFESNSYGFDTLEFLGVNFKNQLATFTGLTKEMTYGTIALSKTFFYGDKLVKLTPCPYDATMFGFPKELADEVNNSTYDYHYLGDPEHQGSSTNFMDFDIIKIAETPEEIDKYFEKYDDFIIRLRNRGESLDSKDEEIDKDKKIEELEKELAKAKEELKNVKKDIEEDI